MFSLAHSLPTCSYTLLSEVITLDSISSPVPRQREGGWREGGWRKGGWRKGGWRGGGWRGRGLEGEGAGGEGAGGGGGWRGRGLEGRLDSILVSCCRLGS